jgi:hypothetical protein
VPGANYKPEKALYWLKFLAGRLVGNYYGDIPGLVVGIFIGILVGFIHGTFRDYLASLTFVSLRPLWQPLLPHGRQPVSDHLPNQVALGDRFL